MGPRGRAKAGMRGEGESTKGKGRGKKSNGLECQAGTSALLGGVRLLLMDRDVNVRTTFKEATLLKF